MPSPLSNSDHLRFPTGHTISQAKRNAKRLAKTLSIPLHEAQDQVAREALGLQQSSIHWAQATRILSACSEYPVEPPEEGLDIYKIFSEGAVAFFDQKDAEYVKANDTWKHGSLLSTHFRSALTALYLENELRESGVRESSCDDDMELHIIFGMECFYSWTPGGKNLEVDEAVSSLQEIAFFAPDSLWVRGNLVLGYYEPGWSTW